MQKNWIFPIDCIESETIFLIDCRRKLSIHTISAIDSGKRIGALKVDFDIPITVSFIDLLELHLPSNQIDQGETL